MRALYVKVALLSELEFKHQVTTARGDGGRRGRGVQESTEVPGCPEDRKRDGGSGGRGVVGMGGPIRAGCLGEEAEKTGKRTSRESASESAGYISPLTWPACLILERLYLNEDSLKLSPGSRRGGFLFQSGLTGPHRRGHPQL